MSFTVEMQKEFSHKSERVKSVDLHPTEPWILVSLHSGNVCIFNWHSQAVDQKSFKVAESPVRSAKFIAREQWFISGADDKFVRTYNYQTMAMVKEFEAHTDFIRSLAVHPSLPYVLSASDDNLIKLWDWEKDWKCVGVFEGHSHYVMQVSFNPMNNNVLASASLDCSIKIWNLGSPDPSLTLEGHSKGVNSTTFFKVHGKEFLISGSDDYTAKVWEYDSAPTCVQTLEGHTNNITAVCVHPEVPIIITGSEDGIVHLWHVVTYSLEGTLNLEHGRVWAIGCMKGSNQVVFGCDEGTIMGKLICSKSWDSIIVQDEEEEDNK